VWRETGRSIVLVSHAIPEAVFLADRILVLAGRPGRIVGDVPVPIAHPRSLVDLDAAMASATSTRVRELLALDESPEDRR
jgi:NitT/TauT family transport system ATP-binding protein